MVCFESSRKVGLYRLDEELRVVTVADGEVMLRPANGMGEDGALLTASWRSSRASWSSERWSSTVVSSSRPAVLWRSSLMSATATGHEGAENDVWRCPGGEVKARADADGEARSGSAGASRRPCAW